MSRKPFLSFCFLLSLVAAAAQSRTPTPQRFSGDPPPSGYSKAIVLWPDGAPLAKGSAPQDVPKLYYYPAIGAEVGSAVIVLPGGGYTHVVMEKEGAVPAKWLAAHGIPAFVLQYRLAPAYRYPSPMLDASRAVRYVRSHASEFGIDPKKIGVWGFSAGGHLAGYLATAPDIRDKKNPDPIERVGAHPDFSIFCYARLSMESTVPRSGNLESLLGEKPTQEMLDMVSMVRHVTKDTSPAFIYSTTADQTVHSMNATAYYDALKRAGVPVELHIFELGAHGTGMGQNLKGLAELEVWPTLLEHWMQLHGWMSPGTLER